MQKSYRIRTKIGEDSHIKVNLRQDFDLLEILSLKLTQSEVYSRLCADYGVVVGRVVANSGLGIPNAKVSVFIPLNDEDAQDEVITALYPYTDVTDKNEEGYRYNLLPTIKQHNRHAATGSFMSAEEVISNPLKLEVYEKYYKFTAKTNENGDFMIWGAPLGVYQIHMSVDVSDIGCFSMKPFNFISQGVSPENFKSSAEFKSSENLDTLPQIVIQNKTIEVVPFWGDDELCNSGISRVDFDLRDSNVEIRPNALLMGSIISDNNVENVSWKCGPSKRMGELCKLTTGSGKIEAVRFTIHKEEDGCTPKLERINLYKIGGNGSFVAEVPMNLDYLYTDEYGNQQISDDPSVGVPTRGKYRFRISFDQEYSSESRKAKYLVPNLREYTNNYFPNSYSFSTNLLDYPEADPAFGDSWETSPAFLTQDYFYEMKPDRVYSVSQFIDLYRNNYQPKPFDGDVTTSGAWPFTRAGQGSKDNRWNFVGIKSTNPAYEADCSGTIKEFPPVDGFRGGSFIFLMTQLNLFVTQLAIFVPFMLLALSVIIGSFNLFMQLVAMFADLASHSSEFINFVVGLGVNVPLGDILGAVGTIIGVFLIAATEITLSLIMVSAITSMKYRLPLTKYDECENCNCGNFFKLDIIGVFGLGDFEEEAGDVLVDDPLCQIPPLCSDPSDPGGTNCAGSPLYYSEIHGEELDNQGRGRLSNKGCYTISYDGSGFRTAFVTALITLAIAGIALGIIPGAGAAVGPLVQDLVIGGFVAVIAAFLLMRLATIFTALNEWRVRKNIYNGLCQGVFNLGFWNSWIRGTLYHFRFENKTDVVVDDATLVETRTDFCCRDIIITPEDLSADNPHYYYRSCPWGVGGYIPDTGAAIQQLNWGYTYTDTAGNLVPGSITYRGNKGINYPTTLTELGTFEDLSTNNYCVDCNEEADTDFFINKLDSSSQKSPAGILDYFINQKMMKYDFWNIQTTGINNWFGGRPGLMTFIFPPINTGFNRNQRNIRNAQYRLLDGDISQAVALNNELGLYKYQSPLQFPSDPQYGPLPTGMIDPDIGTTFALKEMKITPDNVRADVIGGNNGYTFAQQIPYYPWTKTNQTFGDRNNNWQTTQANLITNRNQPGILVEPKTGPIFYGIPQGTELSFGYFHYYFGLYQGNTAYDEFVNKYIPPIEETS